MNFHGIVNFIAAVLIFGAGFLAYAKNARSRINFLFFLLTIGASTWQLGTGIALFSDSAVHAEWGTRLGFIGIALIPMFSYHLSLYIAGNRKATYLLISGYLLAIMLFIPLSWTPMILDGVYEYPWGYFYRAGSFHPVFMVFFIVYMVMAFLNLIKAYRIEENLLEKSRKKYFLIALIIAYAGSIDYLATYGLQVYPLGYLALLCFMAIFTYAIIRYQLMEINIALTRAGVFAIVYFFVLGVPFVLGYRFELWQIALWAMFLSATSGPFLYLYFQRKIEERVKETKLKYLRSVDSFLETVKQVRTLEELIEMVLREATTLIGASYAAFYLLDKSSGNYALKNAKTNGQGRAEEILEVVEAESALVQKLRIDKRTMTMGELRFYGASTDPELFRLVESCMERLNAAIIIPSFYQDELISFIVLDNDNKSARYDEGDIRVFDSLAINVGLAVKNALFVEEMNTMHSDLIAAERLAAIGRLATSAKHEISNPLNIVYGSFQQAMMDIKDRQQGYKRAVEYVVSARDKTEKMLAELNPVKDLTDIDVIAVYDRILHALQRTEDKPTLEQFKGEQKDVLNAITQFIERMRSLTVANKKEQEIKTELIHTAEVAHKHIAKVIEFDELLYETIEKGFRGAGRISQAVNAIYHLPKELEQEADAVNVKELIKESMAFTGFQSYWENLAETGIELQIPETLPDVQGYFNRLVSVFSNIFLNAYQAMTGAELTSTEERLIRIVAQIPEDDPDMVEIRFANKGPLIEERELDKIFRQGYSTKEGNKGLGLDIAKTQVEVFHNGTISVRNIDDFGPEFVVRLPVWEGESAE